MKWYTNSGYSFNSIENGRRFDLSEVSCENHAPKKGSPAWKRQGWRAYNGPNKVCKHCEEDKRLGRK